MRAIALLLCSLFFVSCLNDSYTLDEPLILNETPNSDETVESGEKSFCLVECNSDRRDCYEKANDDRFATYDDCEAIIAGQGNPIYCSRDIIIGYEEIEVISPEGDVVGITTVPIISGELYVCGRDFESIDANLREQYYQCKQQADDEFVDAIDSCDIKYLKCEKSCKDGKLPDGGFIPSPL